MWFEDQFKMRAQASKDIEDAKIANNLKTKYNLDFADMRPLYLDDDKKLTVHVPSKGKTMTNDGCRHYIHKSNGYHYALDRFRDYEWFQKERLLDKDYMTVTQLMQHPWQQRVTDHERRLHGRKSVFFIELLYHDLRALVIYLRYRRERLDYQHKLECLARLHNHIASCHE